MPRTRIIDPGPAMQAQALRFFENGNVLGALRAANGDLGVLRPSLNESRPAANAILSDEEWKQIDEAVVPAAQERLVVVSDLQSAGLIHSIDGLGVLESEFEDQSDMTPAQQTMAGVSEDEEDLEERGVQTIPIPVTHKTFRIIGRLLLSSQRRGEGLDTTGAAAAARAVSEKLEDTVLLGGDITLSGNSIPGLTNFSARQTFTISTAWDSVTANTDILDDVLDMIQKANDVNYFGPFNLYVPGNWSTVMEDDFKAESDMTVRERLESINSINSVRVADRLTDSNAVLVQMTSNVIDLAVAQTIDTVQWEVKGGSVAFFKVMAAMAPRLKQDTDGNTGIVHGS